MMELFSKKPAASLLGLCLDGNRLTGAVLRRMNGSLKVEQQFGCVLTNPLLSVAPEIAGLEIRKNLDQFEIRERRCAVGADGAEFPARFARGGPGEFSRTRSGARFSGECGFFGARGCAV
jgi:hypothetical protein